MKEPGTGPSLRLSPTISVAMCTYNGDRYLGEQLSSLAAQTTSPYELVIHDDASSDRTVKMIEEFAESVDFPVRLQVNRKRLGSTRNFESAIEVCTGDVISLCDQDDVWLPRKLERIGEVFSAEDAVDLVFSDAVLVDADTRPTGPTAWQCVGLSPSRLQQIDSGNQEHLRRSQSVTGATMAFRRSSTWMFLPLPADLAADAESWWIHDGWIAAMVAMVGRVRPIAESLVLYRTHASQQLGLHISDTKRQPTRLDQALKAERANLKPIVERMSLLSESHPALESRLSSLALELQFLEHRLDLPRSRASRVLAVVTAWSRFRGMRTIGNTVRDLAYVPPV